MGPGSVHASIIEGGRELSTYPDRCKLEIERSLIPGETREDVEMEMQQFLQSLSEGDPKFKADYEITFYRAPMEIDPEEEICRLLEEETKRIMGRSAIHWRLWLDGHSDYLRERNTCCGLWSKRGWRSCSC